jgi:hypothetical protein
MNLLNSTILFATLGLAVAFAQTSEPVDLDDQASRELFRTERTLLNQQNFDQLEQIAAEARNTKARFTGGEWQLEAFYRGVQGPGYLTAPDASWNNHIELLKRWAAAKPDSITPRVALGQAYLRFAWKARGSDFEVTNEGRQLFEAHVQQAREVLEAAEILPAKDPQFYCALQTVALAQGWTRPQVDRLRDQVMLLDPTYFYIYTEQTNYLMTKWYGKEGEAEAFAQSAADKVGGEQGDFIYFKIAASENCCRMTQLKALSWERVKRGFAALESMYGSTNFQRNEMGFMAVQQQDQEFARQMFSRIGNDWAQAVWRQKSVFESSKPVTPVPLN